MSGFLPAKSPAKLTRTDARQFRSCASQEVQLSSDPIQFLKEVAIWPAAISDSLLAGGSDEELQAQQPVQVDRYESRSRLDAPAIRAARGDLLRQFAVELTTFALMENPTVIANPAGSHAKGWLGTTLAVVYIFLWASAYVPSKVASIQSPPLWFLSARFLAAGCVLVGIAVALRRPWPERFSDWALAAILGLFGNALYLGMTYTALHRLSAGMGAIIASTNPLLLALVAPYFLKERLSFMKLAGLVMGFGGVLAIVLARTGNTTALPPDVALAFGGVMANVGSTLIFKRYAARFDLMAVTALQMSSAGLFMAVTAACVEPLRVKITPELWLAFAYLVLVLSVGASLLWFWLLTHGEASRVSAYYFLTPAFGLALSACLLHEAVGPRDWAGLIAIVFGIVLVQQRPGGSKTHTAE